MAEPAAPAEHDDASRRRAVCGRDGVLLAGQPGRGQHGGLVLHAEGETARGAGDGLLRARLQLAPRRRRGAGRGAVVHGPVLWLRAGVPPEAGAALPCVQIPPRV